MIRRLALCLMCCALAPLPAAAADAVAQARAAVSAMQQAARQLQDATGADDRVAALSATVRGYETGLAALREGMRQLAVEEAAETGALAAERTRLSRLIGVLVALERGPAPLRLLHPSGPVGAVRAGMILADVAPALERRAAEVMRRLERLAILRSLRAVALNELRAGLESAQTARAALSQAVARRSSVPAPEAQARAARLAALARDARTLAEFAESLGRAPRPPGAGAEEFAALKGRLPLPVRGRILRRPGEADAAGIRRPGLVLAVPARALVTAPATGTLRYRGPLLNYGNVILLETAPDILLVLAGLDVVYPDNAGIVDAGAPLGLMPGEAPVSAEFLVEAGKTEGASLSETLYIEIRKNGEAVDPMDWFDTGRQQESQ